MSHISATTGTTPASVPVVCSNTLSLLMTVTMVPILMGLPATSGQHDVVLPSLLILRDTRGVVGLATQSQSEMPLQAYANYSIGPPQVSFSFRVEPPPDFIIYMGVCCGVSFLLSGTMLNAIFTYGA